MRLSPSTGFTPMEIACSLSNELLAWIKALRRAAMKFLLIASVIAGLFWLTGTQAEAGPPAKPSAKSGKPATRDDDAQIYRNTSIGFRYRVPYGWVDRTKEMRAGNDGEKADVLLAAFERPPETTGESINSAVVIASESATAYSGLKRAEDYLSPLTELAISKGFKAEGEPYSLEVESRQLLRADFIKTLAAETASEKLTMHQCTLVLLAKGQILSFTFIAGSDDELDELMDGLHFTAAKSAGH